MRFLTTILLFILPLSILSQVPDTCFSSSDLIRLYKKVYQLKYQDSLKTELVREQKLQIGNYEKLIVQDSILLFYKDEQVK